MTREDTEPAGGASKNRRANATLRAAEGEYTVHFVTNGRHAYDAFDGDPPNSPEDWGIRVERLEQTEEPGFEDADDPAEEGLDENEEGGPELIGSAGVAAGEGTL